MVGIIELPSDKAKSIANSVLRAQPLGLFGLCIAQADDPGYVSTQLPGIYKLAVNVVEVSIGTASAI
jgi:hypothetical protein